jgi:hypothetical protein
MGGPPVLMIHASLRRASKRSPGPSTDRALQGHPSSAVVPSLDMVRGAEVREDDRGVNGRSAIGATLTSDLWLNRLADAGLARQSMPYARNGHSAVPNPRSGGEPMWAGSRAARRPVRFARWQTDPQRTTSRSGFNRPTVALAAGRDDDDHEAT